LEQLSIELDNDDHIPQYEKRGYILSQQRQKEQEQEQHSNHHQQQQQQNVFYVNSIEFRLMHLRCELFDVKRAARRMVQGIDALLRSCGEYALERKIKLSDFTKNELNTMKKGFIQLLPSRDRGGRRIIVVFPLNVLDDDQGICDDRRRIVVSKKFLLCQFLLNNAPQVVFSHTIFPSHFDQRKIGYYLCAVCASDIENQRKGIVWLFWVDNFEVDKFCSPDRTKDEFYLLPVRTVSIHFCGKDTLIINIAKSLFMARLKTEQRIRFITHLGECVETRYLLKSYGLPVDTIPITWTGTIKIENMKRFMNLRSYIENSEYEADHNNNNENRRFSSITDCPYLNDVLFKKGHHASLHHHSGNDRFRGIVHSVYEQHLQKYQRRQQQQMRTNNALLSPPSVSVSIQILVPHILKGIKQENLRVLVWNAKNAWWDCISDERHYEKQIYTSAFYFLKESSSSPLVQPKSTATATSKSMLKKRHQKQQVSQSGTSIFRPQDDKERKISCFSSSPKQDDLSCGGSNDSAECFGLPFQCIPGKKNDNE
jgi:hypothetical protein